MGGRLAGCLRPTSLTCVWLPTGRERRSITADPPPSPHFPPLHPPPSLSSPLLHFITFFLSPPLPPSSSLPPPPCYVSLPLAASSSAWVENKRRDSWRASERESEGGNEAARRLVAAAEARFRKPPSIRPSERRRPSVRQTVRLISFDYFSEVSEGEELRGGLQGWWRWW